MFIMDQRNKVGLKGGDMQIGGTDRKEAARQETNLLRKQSKDSTASTTAANISGVETSANDTEDIAQDEPVAMVEDDDFVGVTRLGHNQNRTDFSSYIAEVSRYGVSDRAAAALYNAALKTVDAINEDKTKLVVDQAKIRRSREIFSAKQINIRGLSV